MRTFWSIVLCVVLTSFLAHGQNDPKAVAVLDKFASKATSAPSVSLKFLFISNNQAKNSVDTVSGSVIISKDSYKLDLPDNIIWYNGTTSWSFLPAEEEVTITRPDRKNYSFESRPSMIFSMYKEGFKCRLLEEKPDSYLIDLYPTDLNNEMIRVRLSISKPSLELVSFEYKMRSGIIYTLTVTDYNLLYKPEAGFFEFNTEKHKGAEIIDMR